MCRDAHEVDVAELPAPWPRVDRSIWVVALALAVFGVLARNTAALLAAQIAWAAQAFPRGRPLWSRLPAGAVLVIASYISLGELNYLISLVTTVQPDVEKATAGLVLLGSATAAALRCQQSTTHTTAGQGTRPVYRGAATAVLVAAAALPILRPGTSISSLELVMPSFDLFHNMERSALVQHMGFVPYGSRSPVETLSGDFYPRGFHLTAAFLAQAIGLEPTESPELWALDFGRTYWLVWVLVLIAVIAWAVHLQRDRTGSRLGPLVTAGSLAGAALLLPPVFRGIMTPGFPSFATGLLALVVALDALSSTRRDATCALVVGAATAVISHAWLPLAIVLFVAGFLDVIVMRIRLRRFADPRLMGVALVTALVSLRPIGVTVFAGDSGAQAQEPGSIAELPAALLAATAIGIALCVIRPRRGHTPVILGAVLGLVGLEVLAILAAGGEWSLYYPRKVVWAIFVIVVAPAVVAGQSVLTRMTRADRADSAVAAVGAAVSVVLAGPTVLTGLLDRPLLDVRLSAFAHEALNRDDVQMVAQDYMSPDSDYAANRWGHISLELRGIPAANLSDVPASEVDVPALCKSPALQRPLLVKSADANPEICPMP